MKIILRGRLPALKVLTVLSYLFIYASGEKFGAFTFMMFLLYPFMIADGATNIFALPLNSILVVFIDFVFIFSSYWAVFYLMRSGIKKLNTIVNNRFCILGILVLYLYLFKVLSTPSSGAFSLITVVVFILISVPTLILLLLRPPGSES